MSLRPGAALCGAAVVAAVISVPSSALELSLKSPLCGSVPGPGLHLSLTVSPAVTGFTATGTAVLCHATAVVTTIAMQFAGAGLNAAPTGGGPIAGAPFAIEYANEATTNGHSGVASNVAQTVLVDVTAQSLTAGAQFAASCQAVVELVAGNPYIVKGC